MNQPITPATIHFNDAGMPVSDTFDDIYFSNQDGRAESDYVFVQGNRLIPRIQGWRHPRPLVVAETGFGSGLNLLHLADLFLRYAPQSAQLHLVSFERFPMPVGDIAQALRHWPDLAPLVEALLAGYPPLVRGCHRIQLDQRITLDLHFGDVLETLPAWQKANPKRVDAWFLDGFAPSKNPQMWQPALYQAMAQSASSTCTLATFTAVGAVRRGLQQAGFTMQKRQGFAHKREMLVGNKVQPQAPLNSPQVKTVVVIGGGIAAASMVTELAMQRQRQRQQNLELRIVVLAQALADGASGNPQGAVYPLLQADFTPATELYSQAFIYACGFYRQHSARFFHQSGVLQLAFSPQIAQRQTQILQRNYYPPSFACLVSAEQASELSGVPCQSAGLWLPQAGWLEPAQVVKQLMTEHADELHLGVSVTSVEKTAETAMKQAETSAKNNGAHSSARGYRIKTSAGDFDADDVIWATGASVPDLSGFDGRRLDIRPVAGQVTQVNATDASAPLKTVVCHKGYLTPSLPVQKTHCVGATFVKLASGESQFEPTAAQRQDANQNNLALSEKYLPLGLSMQQCGQERVAVRATTADHMPLVGKLVDGERIWILSGLGSRGLTSAPWCARYLVDQLTDQVCATTERLQRALRPQRLVRSAD